MSDARRDWLAGLLAEAAARFGVTLDGEPVRGSYDRTLAARTSGPAWLRVTAQPPEWAQGEIWDGIATATGAPFDAIPMPRHLRSAEWATRWDDVDQVVRADLMTFVDEPAVSTGLVLDHPVDLPDAWWAGLRVGLDTLRRVTATERRVLEPDAVRSSILARFDVEIDLGRVDWEVAHGDLHFGNLTAPNLTILDWEYWGWAPAGYDAAVLACSAILRPDVAARVRAEFADVLGTYSGAVAQLAAADKYLRLVGIGAYPEIADPVRRRAATVLRDQLG
ncbi:phosphotransferase [Promicromonospora sp. NPDC060204]|uniref:phosphotransferase n=1 Tax=Promicromonospora sp. NPDC060204 TaxID=3347071 RepID=UPI003651792F